MDISDRAQEILEKYWLENKEKETAWRMEIIFDDPVVAEMTAGGYARRVEDNLELTPKGWGEAESSIRRHRLAERLLTDVLNVKKDILHEMGCKFEHVLQKDIEENICTLLGHPRNCPHGRPIPEGDCCRENKRRPRRLVLSFSECEVGEKGKIAYIRTEDGSILNKLMAMGVYPGQTLRLIRKTPSYLFQMGESQFAIDRKLADQIYVRILK